MVHSKAARTVLPGLVMILVMAPLAAMAKGTGVAAAEGKAAAEKKYFKMRDKACKLERVISREDMTPLQPLKKLTWDIIGPFRIDGFSGEGDLSFEVLGNDGDDPCEQIDGLSFYNAKSKETMQVTTKDFIDNYLERHGVVGKKTPSDKRPLYELRVALSDMSDADLNDIDMPDFEALIPVKKRGWQDFAYAEFHTGAQELGPWQPYDIKVVVGTEGRVFILDSPVVSGDYEIAECRRIWDKVAGMLYDSDEKSRNVVNDGYNAYRRCYVERAKSQPFFAKLTSQAQSMVDRLKLQ